jgi:hypothetical protein
MSMSRPATCGSLNIRTERSVLRPLEEDVCQMRKQEAPLVRVE